MKAIVAVDNEWNIGKCGNLLFSIPTDMKFFRQTTSGGVVVMGRKTLDSFPNGKPLPKRVNIVLTRNSDFERENVTVCNSVEAVLEEIKKYNADDVYLLGGESVYKLLLPYCDTALVTHVNAVADGADKKFPDLSKKNEWVLSEKGEPIDDNGTEIRFCTYKKVY